MGLLRRGRGQLRHTAGEDRLREHPHDAGHFRCLSDIAHDVRYAVRTLRRSPRVALAAVLRKGLILAAIGVALGLVGAAATSRLLQGMLFGITPLDGWTFASVAFAFSLVATVASYLPARRATTVQPVVALRGD